MRSTAIIREVGPRNGRSSRRVIKADARIDFSYHFIISTEARLASVPRYVRAFGVPSFRFFANNRGGEGKHLGLPDIDEEFLIRLWFPPLR
jgi:hypothetical protein